MFAALCGEFYVNMPRQSCVHDAIVSKGWLTEKHGPYLDQDGGG